MVVVGFLFCDFVDFDRVAHVADEAGDCFEVFVEADDYLFAFDDYRACRKYAEYVVAFEVGALEGFIDLMGVFLRGEISNRFSLALAVRLVLRVDAVAEILRRAERKD